MSIPEKVEINYVAKENVRLDAMRTEMRIQRKVWPMFCGFYVDEYNKMNDELNKGRKLPPIPQKAARCNHFPPFEPEPQNVRPRPDSSNHAYGWQYGRSLVHPTFRWLKTHKSPCFYRQMNWPEGAID